MSQNSFCVYKHTTPSGKVYIGITSMTPSKRWKNGKGYELCTAFNRAVQKYGWENIDHEVVLSGLTKDEACLEEQRLIAEYKSNVPENGYNLTSGGEHYEPNDEWRERLSSSLKHFYETHPEAKERISETQRGRHSTAESNAKRSASVLRFYKEHPEKKWECGNSFRGKKRSAKFCEELGKRKSVPVACVETGEIFASIKEASERNGLSKTSITNMLHGRAKSCKGLTFRYVEEQS